MGFKVLFAERCAGEGPACGEPWLQYEDKGYVGVALSTVPQPGGEGLGTVGMWSMDTDIQGVTGARAPGRSEVAEEGRGLTNVSLVSAQRIEAQSFVSVSSPLRLPFPSLRLRDLPDQFCPSWALPWMGSVCSISPKGLLCGSGRLWLVHSRASLF